MDIEKPRVSDLIDRALKGERIVITRHRTPVIELKAIHAPAKPVTTADLDWLEARRFHPQTAPALDAAATVSHMRDEDEH
jgi:antitoxin (DNA-binding transcriptional repressor) of toxin-antitoxin stability system